MNEFNQFRQLEYSGFNIGHLRFYLNPKINVFFWLDFWKWARMALEVKCGKYDPLISAHVPLMDTALYSLSLIQLLKHTQSAGRGATHGLNHQSWDTFTDDTL